MFTSLIATLLAGIALATQASPPPGSFTRAIERRGEVTVTESFVGLVAPARKDEAFFAGLDITTGEFVTGP